MLPTFVINLDSDTHRLEHMKEQAARANVTFERISGVFATRIPEHLRSKSVNANGAVASDLRPGEVGCYASHLLAYETLLARNLGQALVLEDDVVLTEDCLDTLKNVVRCLPNGWDVVKLCNDPPNAVLSVARVGDRHLVRFVRYPFLAGAYLISAEGARKLLEPGLRSRPIDVDLARPWDFGTDVYGVCPPPIVQLQTLDSSIKILGGYGPPKRDQRRLSWRKMRYRLRTIGLKGLIACRAADLKQSFRAARARGFVGKRADKKRSLGAIVCFPD